MCMYISEGAYATTARKSLQNRAATAAGALLSLSLSFFPSSLSPPLSFCLQPSVAAVACLPSRSRARFSPLPPSPPVGSSLPALTHIPRTGQTSQTSKILSVPVGYSIPALTQPRVSVHTSI